MSMRLCLIFASLLCACDRGAASHLAPQLADNASRAIISPGEAGGGTLPRAPMVRSVAEYFATLDRRFVPSAARGVHAVYELNLTGDGVYEVVVDDGRMQVLRGAPRRPDTILSMNAVEYVQMVNGQVDGTHAYFSRHLRISGSLGLARRMRAMFPPR